MKERERLYREGGGYFVLFSSIFSQKHTLFQPKTIGFFLECNSFVCDIMFCREWSIH